MKWLTLIRYLIVITTLIFFQKATSKCFIFKTGICLWLIPQKIIYYHESILVSLWTFQPTLVQWNILTWMFPPEIEDNLLDFQFSLSSVTYSAAYPVGAFKVWHFQAIFILTQPASNYREVTHYIMWTTYWQNLVGLLFNRWHSWFDASNSLNTVYLLVLSI